jgi:hypothetical protein
MQDSRSGSRSSTASTSHGRLEESNPDYVREVDGKKQYLEEKLLRFLEKDRTKRLARQSTTHEAALSVQHN